MRRVFGGDWTMRAYRNGVPKGLEIRRQGELLWNTPEDLADSVSEKANFAPTRGVPGRALGRGC